MTFALAVLGAWTGTTAWMDARKVDLHVQPTLHGSEVDELQDPFRWSMVNASQRSVSITGGEVFVGERRIGVLDHIWLEPDTSPVGFPITLVAGQSTRVRADWHALAFAHEGLERVLKGASYVLRLRLAPGGSRDVTVPVGVNGGERASSSVSVRSPWDVPEARGRRIATVRATWLERVSFGEPNKPPPGLATLRIWSRSPEPVAVIRRPAQAWLPLPRLADGLYDWALDIDGAVVATGAFQLPCDAAKLFAKDHDTFGLDACAP